MEFVYDSRKRVKIRIIWYILLVLMFVVFLITRSNEWSFYVWIGSALLFAYSDWRLLADG